MGREESAMNIGDKLTRTLLGLVLLPLRALFRPVATVASRRR